VTSSDRLQLALRSLGGLSVGDAFGEQFVGPDRDVLDRIEQRRVPAAPWPTTDDTELALGLVEVLERFGRMEQDALAQVFARRYRRNPQRGYGASTH
jgi:ADP-ribosylglycohydrolase